MLPLSPPIGRPRRGQAEGGGAVHDGDVQPVPDHDRAEADGRTEQPHDLHGQPGYREDGGRAPRGEAPVEPRRGQRLERSLLQLLVN